MSDEAKTPFDEALDATATARSIEEMIAQLPDKILTSQIDETLDLVLAVISGTSKLAQEAYLKQLKDKTKLTLSTLRAALRSRRGERFRGEIEEADKGYKDIESGEDISTFVLEPLRRVLRDDGVEMVEAKITNRTQRNAETIVLPAAALQSRAAFFRRLQTRVSPL